MSLLPSDFNDGHERMSVSSGTTKVAFVREVRRHSSWKQDRRSFPSEKQVNVDLVVSDPMGHRIRIRRCTSGTIRRRSWSSTSEAPPFVASTPPSVRSRMPSPVGTTPPYGTPISRQIPSETPGGDFPPRHASFHSERFEFRWLKRENQCVLRRGGCSRGGQSNAVLHSDWSFLSRVWANGRLCSRFGPMGWQIAQVPRTDRGLARGRSFWHVQPGPWTGFERWMGSLPRLQPSGGKAMGLVSTTVQWDRVRYGSDPSIEPDGGGLEPKGNPARLGSTRVDGLGIPRVDDGERKGPIHEPDDGDVRNGERGKHATDEQMDEN